MSNITEQIAKLTDAYANAKEEKLWAIFEMGLDDGTSEGYTYFEMPVLYTVTPTFAKAIEYAAQYEDTEVGSWFQVFNVK